MKIYTKTGDKGKTSLYGGKRVSKSDLQVEAYGTVDELNSAIGAAIAELRTKSLELRTKGVESILQEVQSDLFSIGAMLAGDKRKLELRTKSLELRIKNLEERIDWMAQRLPEQRKFILPGSSRPASFLHLARAICRRAERRVVTLEEMSDVSGQLSVVLIYLNRLSDFLYTVAKWVNKEMGKREIIWQDD